MVDDKEIKKPEENPKEAKQRHLTDEELEHVAAGGDKIGYLKASLTEVFVSSVNSGG